MEKNAPHVLWMQFLHHAKTKCSEIAFQNWLKPIKAKTETDRLVLQVPNVYVKEYLYHHFKEEMASILEDQYPIDFEIYTTPLQKIEEKKPALAPSSIHQLHTCKLNKNYTFENFVEGPENAFAKNIAKSIVTQQNNAPNLLLIYGDAGLGKTHLLHSIAHALREKKKIKMFCTTTEDFINELIENLKNRSLDRMKRFYRSLDVLLLDDIQFLQNRLNFEEEVSNTIESLLNQNKQIVIACDKNPAKLNLQMRLIGRLQAGHIAKIEMPQEETRVAILQQKSLQKGLLLTHEETLFLAKHLCSNIRELEGAINLIEAHTAFYHKKPSLKQIITECIQVIPKQKVSINSILKSVTKVLNISIEEIKSNKRTKHIVNARQIAMYLALKLVEESVSILASAFGKTHSTLLYAASRIEKQQTKDPYLKNQLEHIEALI
jgi:chromosomal replication initiator protein